MFTMFNMPPLLAVDAEKPKCEKHLADGEKSPANPNRAVRLMLHTLFPH